MLIEIDGKQIVLRPLAVNRVTNCVKVAHWQGYTFALSGKPAPGGKPVVYCQGIGDMKRRSTRGLSDTYNIGQRAVIALGILGLVDAKKVAEAQDRERWEGYFDREFETLEDAAQRLGLNTDPKSKIGRIIKAKATQLADERLKNGGMRPRKMPRLHRIF